MESRIPLLPGTRLGRALLTVLRTSFFWQLTTLLSLAATPFGTSVIPLANGALFPLALAVACNLVGGVLGSTVMYLVWRRGNRELRIARAIDGLPRWARRYARGDLVSLVALRVLPWAGGNLANLLAGTRGVPLRVHVLAATLGSVPGSLLYALLGAGALGL